MPPDSDTAEIRTTTINRVANYFAGQPFGNLLSTIVICGFGYWFWWSQTQGEPQKIKQLQDWQTKQTEAHAEATANLVKSISESHADAAKAQAVATAETIKKISDEHTAQTKLMIDHGEKSAIRRQLDGTHIEEIMREFLGGKKTNEKKGAVVDPGPEPLSPGPLLE